MTFSVKSKINSAIRYVFPFLLVLLLFGCQDDDYTPRPKGYFKIDLPEKSYQKFEPADCPFSFEHPNYTKVMHDTSFFDAKVENPCWMDVWFPGLGGKVHMSYKEIDEQNNLHKLIDDAYKLTFKHTLKAEYIDETPIAGGDVYGMFYEVGGNAASQLQFYVTDSTEHFVRGSLYFNAIPNEDSLAPVIQFVKQDLLHLIETFEWEEVD